MSDLELLNLKALNKSLRASNRNMLDSLDRLATENEKLRQSKLAISKVLTESEQLQVLCVQETEHGLIIKVIT